MKKNDKTTGLELRKLLKKEVEGFDASVSSILQWRNNLGWTAKGTKYCQMIREVNKKRLKWGKENQDTTFKNVIFTDETTVQIEAATSEDASHAINSSLSILRRCTSGQASVIVAGLDCPS